MARRQRASIDGHDVQALVAEFLSVAKCLAMPEEEQRNIVGITEQDWTRCSSLHPDCMDVLRDVHRRRISYVLPLMRRVAENQTLPASVTVRPRLPHTAPHPRTH